MCKNRLLTLFVVICNLVLGLASAGKAPNIVFILADDLVGLRRKL